MLDAQIVLIGVWRLQMRVHDGCARVEARKRSKSIRKVYVMVDSGRQKGVRIPRRTKRTALESVARGCCRAGWRRKVEPGRAREGDLPIKLEIVFSLEHVVEDSPASSDTRLAVMERLPSKAKAWREVCTIGEVHSVWCTLVARKEEAHGRSREDRGLLSWEK